MSKIKDVLRSNEITYGMIKYIRKIQYCTIPNMRFEMERRKRRRGKNENIALERIKKYKDLYLGERCFIVCTGPSLTMADLELIKDEYTFGMNTICKIDGWRPTFYGIQDFAVYEKIKNDVDAIANEIPVFISHSIYQSNKEVYSQNNNVIYMPIFAAEHLIKPNEDDFTLSKDCYDIVYDGYSITMSLIQIAYYMGFKEIYLIGADCNYSVNGSNHFIEAGNKLTTVEYAGIRLINAYKRVKEFADSNDLKVYNATRGGKLEVFTRVQLEDILKRKD